MWLLCNSSFNLDESRNIIYNNILIIISKLMQNSEIKSINYNLCSESKIKTYHTRIWQETNLEVDQLQPAFNKVMKWVKKCQETQMHSQARTQKFNWIGKVLAIFRSRIIPWLQRIEWVLISKNLWKIKIILFIRLKNDVKFSYDSIHLWL